MDFKEEGMVYASVLRPPAFGQKLESYDDTAAKAVPGVIDVIRIGQKGRDLLKKEQQNWTTKLGETDKVVVLANSTWEAFQGKRASKATWTKGTPTESTEFHDKKLLDLSLIHI